MGYEFLLKDVIVIEGDVKELNFVLKKLVWGNSFLDLEQVDSNDELNFVEDLKLEFGFLINVGFMELSGVFVGGMIMGDGMLDGGDYGMVMIGGGMGVLLQLND